MEALQGGAPHSFALHALGALTPLSMVAALFKRKY